MNIKTVTAKLVLFGLLVIVLSVGSIVINQVNMSRLAADQRASQQSALAAKALASAQNAQWQLRFGISQYLAVPVAEDRQKIIDGSPKLFSDFEAALDDYSKLSLSADQQVALDKLRAIYKDYKDARPVWFDLMQQGKIEEAAEWRKKTILSSGAASVKALSELIALENTRLSVVDAQAKESITTSSVFNVTGSIILIAGVVAGFFWLLRAFTKPLKELTQSVNAVGRGDIAAAVAGTDSQDEFGPLALAVEQWRVSLQGAQAKEQQERAALQQQEQRHRQTQQAIQDFESGVGATLQRIRGNIDGLHQSATSLTSDAQTMQTSTRHVLEATNEATMSVETVSAAGQELSKSIHEISQHVQNTATTTQTLAAEALEAREKINGLAQLAQKIGEIVNLINDIASQTNLLALNATIESARAGEAGKGFAVVANEVKHLAGQTSRATEDIAAQVGAIQSETNSVVQSIERISDTVNQVNEMSGTIAAAVEEQNAATSEIARNVDAASNRTRSAAENIGEVADATNRNETQANEVYKSADQLMSDNEDLRRQIENFIKAVGAAR